jgi:3-oxoacyl-[acyl-carrier-protein] synthase II
MSLHTQIIPPTRNHRNPDPEIGLDVVSIEARKADVNVISKHSFGLGGQNACLILRRHA